VQGRRPEERHSKAGMILNNKKPAWVIHGGLKSDSLDYQVLMLSSGDRRPAADRLPCRLFHYLGYEMDECTHVIFFFPLYVYVLFKYNSKWDVSIFFWRLGGMKTPFIEIA
jgi:hypothetical protein